MDEKLAPEPVEKGSSEIMEIGGGKDPWRELDGVALIELGNGERRAVLEREGPRNPG